MKLLFEKGNLLNGHNIIVNPVNCVGVMGKGMALQIKKKYPSTFKGYIEHCNKGYMESVPYITLESDGVTIINLATKRHWKDDSILDLIQQQLRITANTAEVHNWAEIAMPRIGCGLGNLDWTDVEPLIVEAFNHLDITIKIVDLEK